MAQGSKTRHKILEDLNTFLVPTDWEALPCVFSWHFRLSLQLISCCIFPPFTLAVGKKGTVKHFYNQFLLPEENAQSEYLRKVEKVARNYFCTIK